MPKSNAVPPKIRALFALAVEVFGDLLVEIGVGGSLKRDIDALVVLRRIDLEAVRRFMEEGRKSLRQPLSCRVLTSLMAKAGLLDGKSATMLLKGMVFKNGGRCFAHLDEGKLKAIVKQNLGDEVSGILRALLEGKYGEEKAIELLVQLLAICQ